MGIRPYNLEDLPLATWAHPLCGWDATPDLAQATWEWPEPWQPVDEIGRSIALVNDLKALEAYEAR